jgi:hypothetical protein
LRALAVFGCNENAVLGRAIFTSKALHPFENSFGVGKPIGLHFDLPLSAL